MKRLVNIFLSLCCCVAVFSQNLQQFSVVSFEEKPFDTSANDARYKQIDGNGETFSIIKLVAAAPGDDLSAYTLDFGLCEGRKKIVDGEVWWYVQRNAMRATIQREGFKTLKNYELSVTVQPGKVYEMTLQAAPKVVQRQFLVFEILPADSEAIITFKEANSGEEYKPFGNGKVDAGGRLAKSLGLGVYTYRIISTNYHMSEGLITLSTPNGKHVEKVSLRPNFANVTLNAQPGVEIYINEENMGQQSWTGKLSPGTYSIECRKPSHKSSLKTIVVEEGKDVTLQLQAPSPITGTLSLSSNPLGAKITIDGKKYGETPDFITDLVIGEHKVELTCAGYKSETVTVAIRENEETECNLELQPLAISIETYILDTAAHPYYIGGMLHNSNDNIVKKGLIVSVKRDDLCYNNESECIPPYLEIHNDENRRYAMDLNLERKVIDCTNYGDIQFNVPLTFVLGNTLYYIRAFALDNNGTVYYGNVVEITTGNFNREIERHNNANVWYSFNGEYTLFDLATDECIDPVSDGYYYSTDQNYTNCQYNIGNGYNTCYKFKTEWNYRLWYSNKHEKENVASMPIMRYKDGKLHIDKQERDADKNIEIYYSINENGRCPEAFTKKYDAPLEINEGDVVYCYAISEERYITYTNIYKRFPAIQPQTQYEAVDLGLSVKWATCNVGATKPEEYGGYYAWGETEEKDNYSWGTYKWCKGSYDTMTKYCTDSSYGTVDNKTTLAPGDDVAHVKWGGNWRMPTRAEQDELREKCKWEWTTVNGVSGYKVTSKKNGNSIFLPAAGSRYGTEVYYRGSYGYFWSSSLYSSNSNSAFYLGFYIGGRDWDSSSRCYGFPVRPVCD